MLYLIGRPGSGKSTLCSNLTDGLEPLSVESKPFAHTVWPGGVVELGLHRGSFSGTDALSMSVQPKVVAWLAEEAPAMILGEGDRLANSKFFNAVREAGYTLCIGRLIVSASVADERCRRRAENLGSEPQNAGWLAGRVTKAARLADEWDPLVLELDADQPSGRVFEQLLAAKHPLVELLTSQR